MCARTRGAPLPPTVTRPLIGPAGPSATITVSKGSPGYQRIAGGFPLIDGGFPITTRASVEHRCSLSYAAWRR
jgi:hypothetical protein